MYEGEDMNKQIKTKVLWMWSRYKLKYVKQVLDVKVEVDAMGKMSRRYIE